MKKSKVEPLQESLLRISENSLKRLDQKGIETDHNFCVHVMGNGQMFLGSLVASKVFRIMHDVELGKPYMFLIGRNPARGNNDIEGRGDDKKQMAAYNELHRGYASARKGADLSEVFHCMNRDKPRNVRQSITPKSEILTDTCVNGLYAGITKTAFLNENCRPIKGDEMLERYEGKLSRTVLRGGGASNCSFLLGRYVQASCFGKRIHRKGHKEREAVQHESLRPLRSLRLNAFFSPAHERTPPAPAVHPRLSRAGG